MLVLPQGACLLQLLAASAFGNTVCNVVHGGKDDEEVEEEDGLGALLQFLVAVD